MSESAQGVVCTICGQPIPTGQGNCPVCESNQTSRSTASHQPNHASPILAAFLAGQAPKPSPQHRIWQALLDPRTIHWLLGIGSVMVLVGLIVWLAAVGVFDNPLIVAIALGLGNAIALGGGWATMRFSRFQTAGRALTLLACLVMPLNLWFYHANQLVTLEGHLWVAALICCLAYLASALLLRDRLFVYVFNGGIALTGLLMLASAGRFWEIASPATLLVVLGLAAIHAEWIFPNMKSPFSRKRFGLAFFQSGHAMLAAGLLLILGTQLIGDWFYESTFRWMSIKQPAIITESWGPFLALGLVLAGSYAYVYSSLLLRRTMPFIYLAILSVFWIEALVIDLFVVHMTAEYFTLATACLGSVLLACHRLTTSQDGEHGRAASFCINSVMSLAFVSEVLMTLTRLLSVEPAHLQYSQVLLLFVFTMLCLVSACLVRQSNYRRWYVTLAVFHASLALFILHLLSNLTIWDKFEILSIAIGSALLIGGHIGLFRENNAPADEVSACLFGGSLLLGLPLSIAVLFHRCQPIPQFSTPNEFGMLAAGVLMLLSGVILRLRSTTIIGACMTIVYIGSLVLYINMLENIETAAIWTTLGGATIFSTGILLSIYRDRLAQLPEKIANREGLFRVLTWR